MTDPRNPYDFFDTPLPPGDPGTRTGSGTVAISDIVGVIAQFGTSDGGPPNEQGQKLPRTFSKYTEAACRRAIRKRPVLQRTRTLSAVAR